MNNLYKVTITGWVTDIDFAEGVADRKYPPTTPADWLPNQIVEEMTGITINEKLIDVIPFAGELDSTPSAPNNSMRWGSYAVDGLNRTSLQDQLQQFTDCMIDPDGNHACERNGHECKCTCTECYPAWIRCMDHLIEELQADSKHIPVGQRFEYGDVNTCWICQDEGNLAEEGE